MTSDIDDAIEKLDAIVDLARRDGARFGYFAAMYAKVTKAVKQAIDDGEFENPARMASFDLIFANRYLDAFDRYQQGGSPSACWQVAFEGSTKWRPIIVQQLLTGMNAHINLDLGVAAATVAPGADLADLRNDFDKVNDVLARLTDGFMRVVEDVSPWIKLLDRIGGRAEKHVVKFSIDVARDEAWKLAEQLAPLPAGDWQAPMDARDEWTAGFGRFILRPGPWLPIGLLVIRMRESNDVAKVIDVLAAEL